jgi:hypothetical protein
MLIVHIFLIIIYDIIFVEIKKKALFIIISYGLCL